ncbi:vacuolar protein sorting-associated protein 18 homolog [Argopecten irradians]|uniref:vacuolar protein sorting-associated protein 18 homolog n=1 Tax=Argopecten irradians TaxID=31199 RepID=UPI00371576AA
MASILDQYEEESARAASVRTTIPPVQEPIGPGFIDARLDTDVPIFSKKKVNFKPPDPITHMAVCNNFLVISMTSNILLRLDLEHPETPDGQVDGLLSTLSSGQNPAVHSNVHPVDKSGQLSTPYSGQEWKAVHSIQWYVTDHSIQWAIIMTVQCCPLDTVDH